MANYAQLDYLIDMALKSGELTRDQLDENPHEICLAFLSMSNKRVTETLRYFYKYAAMSQKPATEEQYDFNALLEEKLYGDGATPFVVECSCADAQRTIERMKGQLHLQELTQEEIENEALLASAQISYTSKRYFKFPKKKKQSVTRS